LYQFVADRSTGTSDTRIFSPFGTLVSACE
jgi:hypothetical protein